MTGNVEEGVQVEGSGGRDGVSRGLWSDGEGNGGLQGGGVCEGRPRGFGRPVRDVRTVSAQEVCREDEEARVLRLDRWDMPREGMLEEKTGVSLVSGAQGRTVLGGGGR